MLFYKDDVPIWVGVVKQHHMMAIFAGQCQDRLRSNVEGNTDVLTYSFSNIPWYTLGMICSFVS
jgi:hypothetical protein